MAALTTPPPAVPVLAAGGVPAVAVAPLEVAAPTGVSAFYMPEREAIAVAWDRAPGVATYDVLCGPAGGELAKCSGGIAGRLLILDDSPPWFAIEPAHPGEVYEIQVAARTQDGEKSPPSPRVRVEVPLRVREVEGVGGDGRAILQWQMVPDEDRVAAYVILRDGIEVDAVAPPPTRPTNDAQMLWYDSGLRNDRVVRYEVAIRDDDGALRPGPRTTLTPRRRRFFGPTLAVDTDTGALWTSRGLAEEVFSSRPLRALDPRNPRRQLEGVTLVGGDDKDLMVRLDDGTWLAVGANEGSFPRDGVYHPIAVELEGLEATIGAPLVDVALGADHGCGRTDAGDVWCWGADGEGQLGDGAIGGDDAGPSRVLVGDGADATPLTGAIALDVGQRYACAVDGDGRVLCWGSNIHGRLGTGVDPETSAPAVAARPYAAPVLPPDDDPTALDGATAVSTGEHGPACAIVAGGRVWCWGFWTAAPDDYRAVAVPGVDGQAVTGASDVLATHDVMFIADGAAFEVTRPAGSGQVHPVATVPVHRMDAGAPHGPVVKLFTEQCAATVHGFVLCPTSLERGDYVPFE